MCPPTFSLLLKAVKHNDINKAIGIFADVRSDKLSAENQ